MEENTYQPEESLAEPEENITESEENLMEPEGDNTSTDSTISPEGEVSVPVAIALSAALSKIEAYVPTQYMDYTEPDIDAEHLNHAEQAIMRVTNLMNGAVDVINGLQSQVAQINSNFTLSGDTNNFSVSSSDEHPFILRINRKDDGSFYQMVSTEKETYFGKNADDGSWKHLYRLIRDVDINDKLIIHNTITPTGDNLSLKGQIESMWDKFPTSTVFIGSYSYNGSKLYIGFVYPERNYGCVGIIDTGGTFAVVYKNNGFHAKYFSGEIID